MLEELVRGENILAWSLHELRNVKLLVRQSFQLDNNGFMFGRPRRRSPRNNALIEAEVNMVLETEMLVPATSSWSFLVLIETLKTKKPSFCVNYRLRSQKGRKTVGTLQILKNFLIVFGVIFFTTPDLFLGRLKSQDSWILEAVSEPHLAYKHFSVRYDDVWLEEYPIYISENDERDVERNIIFASKRKNEVVLLRMTSKHVAHLKNIFAVIIVH